MTTITIRLDSQHIARLQELQRATGADNRSDVVRALISNSTVEQRPQPAAKLPAERKANVR